MKRIIATLAASLALAGCMSPAPETVSRDAVQTQPRMIVMRNTSGGNIAKVRAEVGEHIFTSDVLCLPGPVYSAHTMYLVLGPHRVRTKPDAVWGFHGSNNMRIGEWSEGGTRDLAAHYPPDLAAWFWANAAHLYGRDIQRITGAQMIANGWAGEC